MSTSTQLRVLVVGASIAGPAAAYWFARAGAKVTVIERFPQLRTNGQAVDIRTVGVTVMRKMAGMEAAVRAKLAPIKGISLVDTAGRPFATIQPTGNPDQQSIVSEYEILRGDLSKILFDLTKNNPNITYIFGEQISSIQYHSPDDTNSPVTVTFTNGHLSPTVFDLIVACDGAASRTRALAFDCPVRAHTHAINAWTASFTIPTDLLNGSTTGQCHSAPGGRFMAFGPDKQPGTNRVTVMGIYSRKDSDAMIPFREAQKQGEAALRQFVVDFFLPSPNPTTTTIDSDLFTSKPAAGPNQSSVWPLTPQILTPLLTSTAPAQDFHASELLQVKPLSLHRGRIVLVGDAGYAPGPTGAGTSLALAGAYVLAGEISRQIHLQRLEGRHHQGNAGEGGRDVRLDLEAALRRYEEVMKPIVEQGQTVPWFVPGVMAPQTRLGLWVRNVVLWAVCGTGGLGWVQRWAGWAFAKREEGGLPEFEWDN
jgi:2-polyprenyl-6-methoxyphenol hydroxylase-like FAD-dependent oxidoreductase